MTNANVESLVARTGVAVVANSVASVVFVRDLGVRSVGAGALRQSVRVAQCELVSIGVQARFVVDVDNRSHHGAGWTDWYRCADQGGGAVVAGSSRNVVERVDVTVVTGRAVQAFVDAVCSVSFSNCEVVVSCNQPVTCAASIAGDRFVAGGVVSHACIQRTVSVANRCAHLATDFAGNQALLTVAGGAVSNVSIEAVEVSRRVQHGVAGAGRVRWEQVLGGTSVASCEWISNFRQGVVPRRVLTTQGQGTGRFAAQANVGLTVEQRAADVLRAGVNAEARLQNEQSRQAAAQIFGAFETDTRSRSNAAVDFVDGTIFAAALADETSVNGTVDYDARLSLGYAGGCCQDCQGDQSLFHCDFL